MPREQWLCDECRQWVDAVHTQHVHAYHPPLRFIPTGPVPISSIPRAKVTVAYRYAKSPTRIAP